MRKSRSPTNARKHRSQRPWHQTKETHARINLTSEQGFSSKIAGIGSAGSLRDYAATDGENFDVRNAPRPECLSRSFGTGGDRDDGRRVTWRYVGRRGQPLANNWLRKEDPTLPRQCLLRRTPALDRRRRRAFSRLSFLLGLSSFDNVL